MATSPIYGWPEPDNTSLVKNGAQAMRDLGNAIDTTMGTMVAKTVVDAKGDLIAGTAADTVNRLAVGSNGETLVADSSTATGLRYTAGTVQANPVLNSAMQIAQRGTSIAAIANYAYNLDRWKSVRGGFALGATYSQQVTNDTTNLPFIQYCARIQRDSGNTSTAFIDFAQTMETLNSIPFAGKTVTLSFYARKGTNYSSTSSVLDTRIYTGTGTNQSYESFTGQATVANTGVTLTSLWQRFTLIGSIGSTATEIAVGFRYDPTGTAGAADYYEITGVQLDIGSVALPFRTYAGTIQGELAACQRYYYRYTAESLYAYIAPSGVSATTTIARAFLYLPVTQRTTTQSFLASSVGMRQISNDTLYTSGTFVLDSTQSNLVVIKYTHGSAVFTAGNYCILTANNSTSAYVEVSAEL